MGEAVSEAELFKAAMQIDGEGFGAIEGQAVSGFVSSAYVVAMVMSAERGGHLVLAFVEGAATFTPGFAGIPFNIVFFTFPFFRAVQSLAMFYGYDGYADPSEMVVVGDVSMAAYEAMEQA